MVAVQNLLERVRIVSGTIRNPYRLPKSPLRSFDTSNGRIPPLEAGVRAGTQAQIFGHTLRLVLSLVITRFPAIATVILPVIRQPKFVISVAKGAIAIASALVLRLVTHQTFKFFGEHRVTLLPFPRFGLRRTPGGPITRSDARAKQSAPNQIVGHGRFKIKDSPNRLPSS